MIKPTPEQIQRACDTANTAGCYIWYPAHYGSYGNYSFTALADTIAKLHAETERADRATAARADRETADIECLRGILSVTQAERDKARADLAEIDRLLALTSPVPGSNLSRAAAIAAPYHVVTDPLQEAAIEIVLSDATARTENQIKAIREGKAGQDKIALARAGIERGLEIGRTA